MGLFKKKEDKKTAGNTKMNIASQLPELPRLPELPDMEDEADMELPKLPSFPNNSLGDKFSQNTIKEAVAGEKEVKPEEAEDFMEDENPMMPSVMDEDNYKKSGPKKMPLQRMPVNPPRQYAAKEEPVFIRLDKFEESIDIFKEAKEQVMEIERLLSDIKELKQKEEEELNKWEDQIQEIKNQIEKVDQDIFSKI